MGARLLRLSAALALLVVAAPGAAAPRELPPLATLEAACAGGCPRATRVDLALQRAAVWLRDFDGNLHFDAAFLLTLIRALVDSDALRAAFVPARARADHDHDHPHRRLWTPDYVAPADHTAAWTAPVAGAARINPNPVLSEALHCRENGWRAATEAYVCGAMRDAGGYHTTHALLALDLARGNGCTTAEACLAALRAELVAAQPAGFTPQTTLDIDLYAERVAVYVRTGPAGDADVDAWIDALLALQRRDGSWGIGRERDPYYRYHATAAAAWALAEWSAAAGSAGAAATPVKTR